LSKIRSPLDMPGGEKQNEYIRNADMTPNWHDIRNMYMNELSEIVDKEFILVTPWKN